MKKGAKWTRRLAAGVRDAMSNAPQVARVARAAGRATKAATAAATEVAGETRDAFHRGLRGEPEPPLRPPGSRRRAAPRQIAAWYANLEVEEGADLDAVHRSWKRLQRKYHPDLHAEDAERAARATMLIQELNAAYAGLKTHLGG